MKLKTWLNSERGRYRALADHLKVSYGRVSQMAAEGMPSKYMLMVRDFTDGEVSLEEMLEERALAPSKEEERA